MYLRASVLLFPVYALASLAAAAPGALDARDGGNSCTSGSALCCTTVVSDDSSGVALIEALVGVTINPIIGPLLATGCIANVGSCTGQTVCCKGSQNNNLVYVGCNNIAL
ncbi:hypothetical protein BKA82DRAFT_30486 [Pisolithus tinctorius]|uniref:Hydrophobin n=1 Tax=Pisolithus tinctorius Marx 270 TaxID=870435 RepID=A0A0C3IR93_PISTI|nr:hypothetical protein BKA82DRAFT_30486 [Pisolithus tinctorius]KIN99442.1 hypothetical protein M404DRAFT_30486 [Pisolithus tinctorius Marx 270]